MYCTCTMIPCICGDLYLPPKHFFSDLSVSSLIRSHRVRNLPIDNDDNYQRMAIRRKYIFQDTLHHLKHYYNPSKYLRVTFLGEPAVDKGGPIRECFHHLVKTISDNNSFFCGPEDKRCIVHNVMELERRTYYYVGMMLGLSLIYGGPAPGFFAPSVDIAFGVSAKSFIYDIPDVDVKKKLIAVIFFLF